MIGATHGASGARSETIGGRLGGRLDAITLDLDDTLWPVAPVIERAESALMDWFAAQAPGVLQRLDLAGLRRVRAETGREAPELEHDLTELRGFALDRG